MSNTARYSLNFVVFGRISVRSKTLFGRCGSDAMLRNPATPELKQFVGSGF